MKHFSASKARSVARTDWNCNLSHLSCARRVLQDSTRGRALHLSAAYNRKVCQMRCTKSNSKFRRPNKNPMDYYSYYLKHYYYLLYCIYMPFDNEFVACVDRKKSYRTPLTTTYSGVWYNKTYNLVVVVVLGLGLAVVVVVVGGGGGGGVGVVGVV